MTSGHLGRRTTGALALSALVVAGLVAAPAQAAGDLVVTNTDDSGAGSLREALQLANDSPTDDRITFAPTVTGTIHLDSDQLEARVGGDSGNLVVEGPGADVLTLAPNSNDRVLEVRGAPSDPAPSVAISGLTLMEGDPAPFRADGSSDDENGGALRAQDAAVSLVGLRVVGDGVVRNGARSGGGISVAASEGGRASLDVTQSTITGSSADVEGGGIFATRTVPVTLRDSVVRGNTAESVMTGFEVFIQYGDGGGIFAGDVTLVDSIVAGNTAQLAGGGLDVRALEMHGSTVSGNSAMTVGGGVRLRGGDVPGQLTATSSTFTDNFARAGGAIGVVGAADAVELVLTTVSRNSAMAGGGVSSPGAALLRGSVVGMNAGGDLDGGGSAVVERSLVQEPRDVEVSGNGSVLDQDPVLGSLVEAGGPIEVVPPAPNSPVIDMADSYGITTDQRGGVRSVDDPTIPDAVDGTDMGAVELTAGELAGQAQVESVQRPTILGTARVGEVLRTDGGVWSSDAVEVSYQWLRNGVPIDGATSGKYQVSSVDRGVSRYGGDLRNVLAVRVTASGAGLLPGTAESDPTGFVQRGTFTMSGRPQVAGSTAVGSTLRAKPRTAAVAPRPEWVSIVWKVGRRTYYEAEDDRRFVLRRGMRGKRVQVTFLYASEEFATLRRVVRKARPVH